MYLLRCLGPPVLERDGTGITFSRKKSVALLAYLAVTEQTHSRESLAALLWPEHDQQHALGYLRMSLSEINTASADRLLDVERQAVRLSEAVGIVVDVRRFRELTGSRGPSGLLSAGGMEQLAEAVRLYRAGFLEGFSLRGAPDFDEWQRETAEELLQRYQASLEILVPAYSREGDFAGAAELAAHLVHTDELNEAWHRLLMSVYALAGKPSAAERQFERCRRMIKRDLGAEPSAETTHLVDLIRSGRGLAELRDGITSASCGGAQPASGSARPREALASQMTLNFPEAVAVDARDRIYVTDTGNHRIVRMDDLEGNGWKSFGSEGDGEGQFRTPCCVWLGPSERIFVSDRRASRVVSIDDMDGVGWASFGSPGSGAGRFNSPQGICTDPRGRILIADTGNNRIVRIDDMSGRGWVSLGGPKPGEGPGEFWAPGSIFVDAFGWIYVSNHGSRVLVRMDDLDGSGWSPFALPGAGLRGDKAAQAGLVVDSKDRATFVVYGSCVMRLADMTGLSWTRLSTKPGSRADNADVREHFFDPAGLCLDSHRRILVADKDNNRIVRVNDMSGAGWAEYPPPA